MIFNKSLPQQHQFLNKIQAAFNLHYFLGSTWRLEIKLVEEMEYITD